jgi:hypothetical protein
MRKGFLDERGARAVVEGFAATHNTKRLDGYRSFMLALEAEGFLMERTPIPRRWGPPRTERVVCFDWMVRDGEHMVREIAAMVAEVDKRGNVIFGTGEYLFVVSRHAWERLHQRKNSTDVRVVLEELAPVALAYSKLSRVERAAWPGSWLITPNGAAPLGVAHLGMAGLGSAGSRPVPVLATWLADDRTWPERERRLAEIRAARERGQVRLNSAEVWEDLVRRGVITPAEGEILRG